MPSVDWRRLVWSTASLSDVIIERPEQMIDAAEQAPRDGLSGTFVSRANRGRRHDRTRSVLKASTNP
jgi:hypothetical protein